MNPILVSASFVFNEMCCAIFFSFFGISQKPSLFTKKLSNSDIIALKYKFTVFFDSKFAALANALD